MRIIQWSRHRRRLLWLMMAMIVLSPCARADVVVSSEPSHGVNADPNYDIVFPDDRVLEFHLLLEPDSWNSESVSDWVAQGTLQFDDLSWKGVELRISAEERSTWQARQHAPNLHLRFETPAAPAQRFFGFSELELRGSSNDPTRMRTKTALDLVRQAGVATPRAAYCKLTLEESETKTVDIYTIVEIPALPMLDTQFDEDDGSLYIVEGDGARLMGFDPHAFLPIQLADAELEIPSPEVLVTALHAVPRNHPSWRTDLESVFDVHEFLRGLAMRTVLGSNAGYGRTLAPLTLYWDPGDGRFHHIPNQELQLAPLGEGFPIEISLDDVSGEWPLIRLIADDPTYFATYLGYVNEGLKGGLQVINVREQLRRAQALLEPIIDNAEQQEPFLPSADDFVSAVDDLLLAIEDRYALAQDFLFSIGFRESPIVISELHYNPSLDQGIDNNFEFVELFNRGNRTIDLSGYMFVEGLEFALPPRTILSPGQCLLLTKRAETYRDAPCEVQQWARGSLSNGGERIRFVNREGIEIDSVKYDDVAPWPEAADAGGSTLEIIDPDTPNYTYENWRASEQLGGSPGWIEP